MTSIVIAAEWRVLLGDRFCDKVAPQPTGCWHWTGSMVAVSGGPRGKVWHHGSPRWAYRVSLAAKLGKDERAIDRACHTCDNTRCVNPEHLFEGTQSENLKDCVAKGRLGGCVAKQMARRAAMDRQRFLRDAGPTIRAEIREFAFAAIHTI